MPKASVVSGRWNDIDGVGEGDRSKNVPRGIGNIDLTSQIEASVCNLVRKKVPDTDHSLLSGGIKVEKIDTLLIRRVDVPIMQVEVKVWHGA